MSEPTEPTWDHQDASWNASDDVQEPIWQAMWNWHLGRDHGEGSPAEVSVDDLAERLGDPDEAVALNAAYRLGELGEAGVPALIDALKDTETEDRPRNAGYGFSPMEEAAVPALRESAKDSDAQVRARAVDVLGDLGLRAKAAAFDLMALCQDEDEDVRSRAVESPGTVGQGASDFVDTLANRLVNDESDLVRRNAALSLARLGPYAEGAIRELAQAMRDGNHYVRGFAVQALYRIGTPEAFKAAMDRLQTLRWDSEPKGQGKRDRPNERDQKKIVARQ